MGAPRSPPRHRLVFLLFHSRLCTSLNFQHCSAWMGCSAGYVLLDPHRRSLAWICSLQFHSALLHRHQHSPCPPSIPHQALLLSLWRTSFPPGFIILPFKLHFNSLWAYLNSKLLDITNWAKRLWNSISPTRQTRIIRKYKEQFQLLFGNDQLCVPTFVGPDEVGDLVDDIETMFNWYHSNWVAGLLFRFYQVSFLTQLPFTLVLLNQAIQTIEW